MAEWPDWDTAFTFTLNRYAYAEDDFSDAEADRAVANAKWGMGDYNVALYYLIQSVGHVIDGGRSLLTKAAGYDPTYTILWCLKNIETGVDMDTLLSTMLGANPEQVTYFIGLVDAYRQSIWNKPFNEEYFAALARGFEQWP